MKNMIKFSKDGKMKIEVLNYKVKHDELINDLIKEIKAEKGERTN